MFLLDTNVISEQTKSRPTASVIEWFKTVPPEFQSLSVVSMAEIVRGIEGDRDLARQTMLRAWLEDHFKIWLGPRLLPINGPVAELSGNLAAQRSLAGRPISFQDACIAATAIHFQLTLVTRNVRDFEFLPLKILDPWNDSMLEQLK